MNLAEHITKNPATSFSSYMGMVSGSMGFDPTKIPLDKFEAHLNSEADPSKLNPILFETLEEVREREAKELEEKAKESGSLVDKYNLSDIKLKTSLEAMLTKLSDSEDKISRDMGVTYERYDNLANNLSETRAQLIEIEEAIKNGTNTVKSVVDQILEIESKGWWKFVHRAGDHLYFLSGRIHLTHINPAAGINYQKDFGQFILNLDIKHSKASCYGVFGNPVKTNGSTSMHPHVNASGKICWGNGADRFYTALRMGKITDALNMVQALLTTYEPSNPYKTLQDYVRHYPETYPHNIDNIRQCFSADLLKAAVNSIPYSRCGVIDYVDPREKFKVGRIFKYKYTNTNHRYYVVTHRGSVGFKINRLFNIDPTANNSMVIEKLGSKVGSLEFSRTSGYEDVTDEPQVKEWLKEYIKRNNKNYDKTFHIIPELFLKEVFATGLSDDYTMINGRKVTYLNDSKFVYNDVYISDQNFKPVSLELSNPVQYGDLNADQCRFIIDKVSTGEFSDDDLEDYLTKNLWEETEICCEDCGSVLYLEGEEIRQDSYSSFFEEECSECGYINRIY